MPTIQSIVEGAPIRIEISGAQGPRGRDAVTEVVTGNITAANDYQYNVTASAVITDPTGVEGKGYSVFVVGGSATVGGVFIRQSGTSFDATTRVGRSIANSTKTLRRMPTQPKELTSVFRLPQD